jgi:hypothetical protein
MYRGQEILATIACKPLFSGISIVTSAQRLPGYRLVVGGKAHRG